MKEYRFHFESQESLSETFVKNPIRNPDIDRESLSCVTLYRDGTAMEHDHFLDDGESNSYTIVVPASPRFLDLIKFLRDKSDLLGRYSRTIIRENNPRETGLIRASYCESRVPSSVFEEIREYVMGYLEPRITIHEREKRGFIDDPDSL